MLDNDQNRILRVPAGVNRRCVEERLKFARRVPRGRSRHPAIFASCRCRGDFVRSGEIEPAALPFRLSGGCGGPTDEPTTK